VTGFGLDANEARTVADRFGVAVEQVRRDHLISHILAALSASHGEQVIFFGGTALARTHLPTGRLSEDIDLIATGVRRETAATIQQTLQRALRRSHGRISWAPGLTAVRDTDAAVIAADEAQLTVRIQLLDRHGYPPWPTEMHAIQQRYSDADAATLRVPTASSFAAWKTVAWHDRHASRDLWDLRALAQRGDITERAAELFIAHGPFGNAPQPWMFTSAPTEEHWQTQLAGQTHLTASAAEALQVVTDAWARASAEIIS
jgi:predicted nucleotidyltransferase component of viral defense system